MQRLIVKSVEEKKSKDGSKTFYILTDSKGGNFSSFESLMALKPGTTIEAEIEVSGKYANLKEFKVIEQVAVPQPPAEEKKPWQVRADSPEQRASIEAQVAAKIVAELIIAQQRDWNDELGMALYSWLKEKLGVKPFFQEKVAPAIAKPVESQPEASIAPSSSGRTAGFEPAKSDSSPGGATKPFNLKEFTATQAILAEQGMTKWVYNNLLMRLSEMTGLQLKTVAAGLMKLSEEQRNALVAELNEDFKKAQ